MHPAISREFHFGSLLRFALPTVIMMIFMSMYTIVDGIFVSRFVGTDALSATNIVYPALNLVLAVAIMLSTGGSAIVARKLGRGRPAGRRESFALIVAAGVAAGVVIGVLGLAFLEPLCSMLGANGRLMADCKAYLGTLMLFVPASVLQILFQSFFVTAGRPGLGLGPDDRGGDLQRGARLFAYRARRDGHHGRGRWPPPSAGASPPWRGSPISSFPKTRCASPARSSTGGRSGRAASTAPPRW